MGDLGIFIDFEWLRTIDRVSIQVIFDGPMDVEFWLFPSSTGQEP
jgi:hypothetical protein